MSQTDIKITWELQKSSLEPKNWKILQDSHKFSTASEVDQKLGWPAGVESILRQAFSESRDRSMGWDLTHVCQESLGAYQLAAGLYKRGVATSPSVEHPRQGGYPITFNTEELPTIDGDGAFVVIDENVLKAWPHLTSLDPFVVREVSEKNKSLDTVAKIIDAASLTSHRHWIIIGGGILSDVAMFAASLTQAVVDVYPTTLLAMVDASVGGKSGVNFPPFGKNQLGSFYFPRSVVISPSWLKTLDQRHVISGLMEGLKHGLLIDDKSILNALEEKGVSLFEDKEFSSLLRTMIEVKAKIVTQDPNESGLRATLNLGHTLAHALEAISHEKNPSDPILHGEAVGFGLVFASLLSKHLGIGNELCYRQVSKLVKKIMNESFCRQTLQRHLGSQDLSTQELVDAILRYIGYDKKNAEGKSRWVFLANMGEIARTRDGGYTHSVDADAITKAWLSYINQI